MKKYTTFILLLIALISCSEKEQDENILIKIDNVEITSDDFKKSFEYAVSFTKIGPNPRRVYLNYMIRELLISREGYRLGFDKSPYVSNRVANRKNADLIEGFVRKYVENRVKIAEDELHAAIKKGSVKFRMVIWPTSSLRQAEDAYKEATKTNLEDYIEKILKKQEVPLKKKKFFETDWLDYLSMPPEIFKHIKDLEIGKCSEPIPMGDGFSLVQILGINREGIKIEELKHGLRRKKMEARLFNIKADALMRSITDSILTPMNIKVKGNVVDDLSPHLYQWFKDGISKKTVINDQISNAADTAKNYIVNLQPLLDETLLIYNSGEIKVRDYFDFMNYYRKNLKASESIDDFRIRIVTEIGRMMKNSEFIRIAKKDGFEDSTWVKRDLQNWEQKWTYEVYRSEIVKNITVSEDEMHNYFKHRWRELEIANVDTTRFYKYENDVYNAVFHEKYLVSLDSALEIYKKKYDIYVDYKLLDELELQDDPKSVQTTFLVRKNFNWQQVVPIVDLKWLSL